MNLCQCWAGFQEPRVTTRVVQRRWSPSRLGGGSRWLTTAGGQAAAPLPVGQALGLRCPFQVVPRVAHKLGHIVQVELSPLGQAIGRVARVAAGDGYNQKLEMLFLCLEERGLSSGGKKNKNQTGRATMEKTHINSETHTDFKDLWPALLKYWIKLRTRYLRSFYWHKKFSEPLSKQLRASISLTYTVNP